MILLSVILLSTDIPVVYSRVVHPHSQVVLIDSIVQLVCEVSSGDLPIFMSWTNPVGAVFSAGINDSISLTTSVTFSSSLDYGNYTCTANNSFGVASDVLNVIQAGKTSNACDR